MGQRDIYCHTRNSGYAPLCVDESRSVPAHSLLFCSRLHWYYSAIGVILSFFLLASREVARASEGDSTSSGCKSRPVTERACLRAGPPKGANNRRICVAAKGRSNDPRTLAIRVDFSAREGDALCKHKMDAEPSGNTLPIITWDPALRREASN